MPIDATVADEVATAREIEELSLNAWPAIQTICYDGWLLRSANGFSRRANSIQTLYPSRVPILDKIQACERYFASIGQPAIFKIHLASIPSDLDDTLEGLGYHKEAETTVAIRAISNLEPRAHDVELRTSPKISDRWVQAIGALNGVRGADLETMHRMLQGLSLQACFASVERAGDVIAVGMAVREREHIGLFDIVTAENHRNQGIGRRLVSGLMDWGAGMGATLAYLQVMRQNAPALKLYANLGFRPVYDYWYRTQSAAGD